MELKHSQQQTQLALSPNLSWETAVDAFLWSKKVVGCSNKTLEWHLVSLRLLQRCHQELSLPCPSPQTCSPSHIKSFLSWLQSRGVRATSISTYFRSIRAFFNWLVAEGLREESPAAKIPQVKPAETLPRTVTEEHFLAAIKTLDTSKFHDLRNMALFLLAYDTGARLGELISLRVGQVDLENRVAKVMGKGGRERLIVFGQKTALFLRKYLTQRMLRFNTVLRPEDFLFVFKNGSPLSARYVLRAWHRAQKRAGLAVLPFHGLRHGFARLWLLRGGDAISLQMLMGHKTPTMTSRYVNLWGKDLREIHSRVSPVDGLMVRKTSHRSGKDSK